MLSPACCEKNTLDRCGRLPFPTEAKLTAFASAFALATSASTVVIPDFLATTNTFGTSATMATGAKSLMPS